MNAQLANIKLTSELENNKNFSFLDINVSKTTNGFYTFIHRKPTFSGAFTNFKSFIDEKFQESLMLTLLHRCYQICSSNTLIHAEIANLRIIFQNNEYPVLLMSKCIKIFLKKFTEK